MLLGYLAVERAGTSMELREWTSLRSQLHTLAAIMKSLMQTGKVSIMHFGALTAKTFV